MSSKGTAFEIRKLHFLRAGHGFGRRLDVDGVVRAAQIAPARRRAGQGRVDALRCDLTRRAVGRIIKCRQLVLDGALYLFRIDVLVPFRPRDRATLVGVDLNQTGVDRKAFTTNKAGRNARPDQPLEYKPENIVIPEALIARPREHRVIWNFILNAKPAEPAIRKVDLDFATERSL